MPSVAVQLCVLQGIPPDNSLLFDPSDAPAVDENTPELLATYHFGALMASVFRDLDERGDGSYSIYVEGVLVMENMQNMPTRFNCRSRLRLAGYTLE